MLYVDVILPLGVEGLLTYSVPERLEGSVKEYVRTVVPLGKSKKYTGLIVSVHRNPPEKKQIDGKNQERNIDDSRPQERTTENGKRQNTTIEEDKPGIEVKDIIDVLDDTPVLLEYQYRLWQWIADYYLCPIGDVFRAAFPAGMKQEDGYTAKTETYVRLTPAYRSEASINLALNMLRKASKQLEAFNTYLFLSHYDTIEGEETKERVTEITREELTNNAKCSNATVKALVERGILETYEVTVGRLNHNGKVEQETLSPLTVPQQKAYDDIMESPETVPTLLQGVTGSGKTEIYIHLIQQYIDEGRQVLYLLPEIALTVQMTERLQRVFGNRMAVYHSRYSDAERVEIWHKQLSDKPYDIILGARSAVFLPFQRLGMIIIDEEHETSFKQQDPAPRYHTRSIALMMGAKMGGVRIVLGTATPSMESYHNAMSGKFRLVQLTERYQGMELPETEVVDIADLQRRKMMQGPFSPRLLRAMREALDNGRQVILFQNRRGFAPMVECHECGWVPKCKNCDVTLTMHKMAGFLTCHYCGFTYSIPQKCPSCFCKDIREKGYGTEKIEEYLANMGFEAISRMDLDTTRTKNAYERIIKDFAQGKTKILIGTQMVTKGLDFANVGIVGILNADSMMNIPDFRAYEYTFQMLCQVSGRAGRQGERGKVILQTKKPQEPVIRQVTANDFTAFYAQQCEERSLFRYPPYTRVVYIFLRHSKEQYVENAAIEMGSRLRQLFGSRILGPDRPAVARIKAMFIRKIVVKLEIGIDLKRVRTYLQTIRRDILNDKRYASMQIYYDVDPQ